MTDLVSRRTFLAAAGAAGTAWVLADPELVQAALAHARAQATRPAPHQFAALTAAQAADLEAIAMRIFPSDGSPGAKEAGVIHFIDKSLTTFAASQKPVLLAGLEDFNKKVAAKWPGKTSFASLAPEQQDAILKENESGPLFRQMRFATIIGMFGNPSYGGNRDKAGWKLLGFEDRGIFQPPFGYYDAEAARTGGQ